MPRPYGLHAYAKDPSSPPLNADPDASKAHGFGFGDPLVKCSEVSGLDGMDNVQFFGSSSTKIVFSSPCTWWAEDLLRAVLIHLSSSHLRRIQ